MKIICCGVSELGVHNREFHNRVLLLDNVANINFLGVGSLSTKKLEGPSRMPESLGAQVAGRKSLGAQGTGATMPGLKMLAIVAEYQFLSTEMNSKLRPAYQKSLSIATMLHEPIILVPAIARRL